MIATAFRFLDPAVPGTAVVGDDHALAAALADAGEELEAARYLRHKPGTSLVRGLRLASGPAFAYAVAPAAWPKLHKTLRSAPAGSVLVADPGRQLLIARPAADRDLPAIAALGLGAREVLAYKPQRRWVGRSTDTTLRVYRPAALPAAVAAWSLRGLAPAEIAVPSVLSASVRRGVLVAGWLPGESLDRLEVGAETWFRVGAGLAGLHGAAERSARPAHQGRDDRVRRAAEVTDQVGGVLPELAPRMRTVLGRLAASAPAAGSRRPVHGDFSADQVIVDPTGRLAFADWDRAGWGDPAGDLGSLIAAGLHDAAHEQVLAGYASIRDLPPDLDWATAHARLLRLADPLRECRPDWAEQVAARLVQLEQEWLVSGDFAALQSDLGTYGLRLRRAWPRRSGQLLLDVDAPELGRVAGQWFADATAAHRTAERTPGALLRHRLVLQPAGADRVLTQLAPLLRRPGARLVGHRPERRAVVAVEDGRRFAKLVPADRVARLRHGTDRTQRLPVRTPRLCELPAGAGDPLHHTVTTQTLPGVPLAELLAGPRAAEALIAVGSAVADLHRLSPLPGSGLHGPADEVAVTRTWERRAREFGLEPDSASARDELPAPPSRLGLIHRDLHDGQFVLAEDGDGFAPSGVGLLDFDLMAAGDPALDLANLIEHLHLRHRQGQLRDAETAVTALLEGYRPDSATLEQTACYRRLAARRIAAVYAFRSPDIPT